MTFSRISGLAGIAFGVLILGPNLILAPAGLPLPGAEPSQAAAFFTSSQDLVGLSSALTPLTWSLATLFGAGAVAVLWPGERARGEAWSVLGFAGLLMQNVTFTALIATRLALTIVHQPAAVAALWALQEALLTLNGTFLATAMVGLSVAGLRAGLIRAWHGGLGLLAAALQFGGATLVALVIQDPGPLGLLGLTGWLLWVVWIIGYGIILLRRRHPLVQPQPAPSTP